jgi:formate/nitrite transporter
MTEQHSGKPVQEKSAHSEGFDDRPPAAIAKSVSVKLGVAKANLPWGSVLILGFLAGAYIAFGAVLAQTVTFDLSSYLGIGFSKFLAGSVFSVGLMLVIIGGAELFTGNNLMVVSLLDKRIGTGQMLAKWGGVFLANFIGAVTVAALLYFSGLWKTGSGALGTSVVNTAAAKTSLPFGAAMVRAIGCNWLVCLAVWLSLASRNTVGKIFAIFFPIMAFVAMGFEHSVANMYFIPAGLFLKNGAGIIPAGAAAGTLTWGRFLYANLLPVTIGNIIGGSFFVGTLYWLVYLRKK